MTTKPRWDEIRKQPFLYLALVAALGASACAYWWEDSGEESTVAAILALATWAGTGVLAFVSGYRLERPEWNVPPVVHGFGTALIALGLTFGAMILATVMVYS